jgi:3-hydroxyacyl-CoA dehydrogenase/enoyl-CoA hydratase/3-hydroxybutyryl-CoA epimerase
MTDFHYSVDADGVATITWDIPNKSMNVLSLEGI